VDEGAVEAAREMGLPLLRLEGDAALHDIEQEVMRLCALYQARREIQPAEEQDLGAWVDDLLAGKLGSAAEARAAARRQGVALAERYAVVAGSKLQGQRSKVKVQGVKGEGRESEDGTLNFELATLNSVGSGVVVRELGDELVVLVPVGELERVVGVLAEAGVVCGVGGERGVLEVGESLEEARLAAVGSARLYRGRVARYDEMGADRLLVLMYRDHPEELRAFVEATLGPLIRYDAGSPAPVMPTLRVFVEHGGRLRETAAAMYVHRNTLAYRLEKVEEILGVDLREPGVRLSVELALRGMGLVE
jgi:sugar diacid utilization regulator